MYSYDRCPNPVHFDTLLLLLYYSSVIETLICRREREFIGFTFIGFAQNTIDGFQNTALNS